MIQAACFSLVGVLMFFIGWCVDVFHCVGVLIMKFDRYILAVLCCQIPLKDAFFYKKTD
ncbi:hypothetical protein [Snodgrassella alvi]|uniref:hypothetical protein n=1 Tax=Snodgrassella alvi TaxID=1196083 RepID=UPI0015D54A8D|nr:hypothetical protein [Snodgrassella alvi]